MNTQYLSSFIKDLKALKSTPYYETIKVLAFEEIPQISNFEEISNPKAMPLAVQSQEWFYTLFERGYEAILPEIIDYEIRGELLRANKDLGGNK